MALMIEETECEALSFHSQIGCAFPKVLSSFVFGLPKAVSLYFSTVPSVIAVKQTVVDRQTPWSKLPPSVFLQLSRDGNFKVLLFVCWVFFFWRGILFPVSYVLCCAEGSSGLPIWEPIPKILCHWCGDLAGEVGVSGIAWDPGHFRKGLRLLSIDKMQLAVFVQVRGQSWHHQCTHLC